MTKILLMENDIDYIYIIKNELEQIIGKYQVFIATNKQEGISILKTEKPDAVFCNMDMLSENAYETLTIIRHEDKDVIIIYLLSKTYSKEIITAYHNGMNAYLVKPFMPLELCACVDSLLDLRNRNTKKESTDFEEKSKYSLDTKHCILIDSRKDNQIYLTKKETLVLELLNNNKGNIVRREEIIMNIWDKKDGEDTYASRSLDVVITRLRKKIDQCGNIQIITAKGVGLRLEY